MADAGSPGISRGRMKLRVSAAQSVMKKNSRRRMMTATEAPFSVPRLPADQ